jgi:hypothetical protein
LSWAGLLDWHRLLLLRLRRLLLLLQLLLLDWDRLHSRLVQLEIGLEFKVEAALASVLADISLPRGRWLLDLSVLGVHVWLWGSLRPVVRVLAHRVSVRRIIKSDGGGSE